MNIKELKEKRNKALDKMDAIKDAVNKEGMGKEARSLTQEEATQFQNLVAEVEGIDAEIRNLQNTKGNQVEAREMENTENLEVRQGYEDFVRNKQTEKRAQYVNTTADGAVVIPENISNEIIGKMEETSPVFALARKYPSVNGSLKIAKENTDDQAGFVGENEEIPSIRLKFGSVSLNQKRVGAAVTLTQQLLNDSGMNLLNYSSDLLARRCARAIEKSVFKGLGGEQGFQGILSTEGLAQEGLNKVKIASTITPDNLLDIINSLNPAYLDGAVFFMSRETYNAIAKIKDGNGDFLLQGGTVNGRVGQTILGFGVHITDALSKEDGILFGNIGASYGIMIKKGFALKHVTGDTQQTLNGTQLLAFDGYMDGALINAEALVYANTSV